MYSCSHSKACCQREERCNKLYKWRYWHTLSSRRSLCYALLYTESDRSSFVQNIQPIIVWIVVWLLTIGSRLDVKWENNSSCKAAELPDLLSKAEVKAVSVQNFFLLRIKKTTLLFRTCNITEVHSSVLKTAEQKIISPQVPFSSYSGAFGHIPKCSLTSYRWIVDV